MVLIVYYSKYQRKYYFLCLKRKEKRNGVCVRVYQQGRQQSRQCTHCQRWTIGRWSLSLLMHFYCYFFLDTKLLRLFCMLQKQSAPQT